MLLVASTRASTSTARFYSVASKARKGRPAPSASAAARPSPSTTYTAPLSASPSPLYSHPAAIAAAGTTPGSSTLVQQDKGKGKASPDDAGWRDSLSKGSWAEPPLVAKARGKTVKQRNVWESYLVLPAQTRLYLSLGLFAVGLIGLYGGDWLVPDTAEEIAIKEGDVLPVLVSTGAGAGEVGGSGRV
ncbi:hypothetical protein BCR35DRAFT_308929 [Leucosporidium creatinivorum]|uniref:Uncharacterized protein n=1 Tax=Leucosporidium creatinivorum TaxID=106004 RepID=A0A1Y2DU69_9BASI|nr:hypothetical protein BCR35DRAFT_308929 [Leucosporidium creatinivorum]